MENAVHDAERLKELQSLPLSRKIQITQTRIIEWYQHFDGNVCISFSGGKDSTVLLHIARKIYPDIPAVFSNTGLEYPEIQRFVKSLDNVDIVTPSMRFTDVVTKYGYPLIGKEVAEAIYYARKIRSQSVQVERERTATRKKNELRGIRTISEQAVIQTDGQSSKESGGRETTRRRTNLMETVGTGGWKTRRRAEISGSLTMDEDFNRQKRYGKNPQWYNYQPGKRDRIVLSGFKAGVASTTANTGQFSNQTKTTHEAEKSTGIDEPG